MESFFHDEEGFENWCKDNWSGFVFNFCSKTYPDNIIHNASCKHLWYKHNEGKRTSLRRKICSNDIQELVDVAKDLCGDKNWGFCKTCLPKKRLPKGSLK